MSFFAAASFFLATALTPVQPGSIVLETRIDCRAVARLPCQDDHLRRAAIVYSDGKGRALVAAVPALAEDEVKTAMDHVWTEGSAVFHLRRLTGDFAANVDLYEFADASAGASVSARARIPTESSFDPEKMTMLDARTRDDRREVRLLSIDSDRTFVPLLSHAFEVRSSAKAPFSEWSGTGVFDATAGSLVGIVGDEFLELRPGKPTRLIHYVDAPNLSVDHAVVFPEAFVRETALRLARNPTPLIRRLDVSHFVAAGVESREVCDSMPEGQPPSGKDFPVGGANGNGVGGILTSGKRCKIQFGRAGGPPTAALPAAGEKWFHGLMALPGFERVEAWYTIDRQNAAWILTSAGEFYRAILSTNTRVPRLFAQATRSQNPADSAMYSAADQVASWVVAYLNDPRASGGDGLFNFLAEIYTLARLAQSDAREIVTPELLDALRTNRDVEWWLISTSSASGASLKTAFARFSGLGKSPR